MPDFAKMYRRLFNSQTDAIAILVQAQRDAEEMYVSSPDADIRILEPKEPEDDKNSDE